MPNSLIVLTRSVFACLLLTLGVSSCQRESHDSKPATSAEVPSLAAQPSASANSSAVARRLEAPVHLPVGLAASQKAPLLVILHGLGSSGDEIESASDWPSFANQHGIAWVAPSGPLDRHGRRFWNAGPSCCNFDASPVDHVAALAELIQRLIASAPLDSARVFVGGHSNGGFMAHRFACERPELVRGIVSVAGAGPLDRSTCQRPSALRVLQIQGDADPIVTYAGGHLFKDPSLPEHASARKSVADWAAALGCREGPTAGPALDFESGLPGAETRTETYAGCTAGSVTLWTVRGGTHYLGFRSPAPELIWNFLSR